MEPKPGGGRGAMFVVEGGRLVAATRLFGDPLTPALLAAPPPPLPPLSVPPPPLPSLCGHKAVKLKLLLPRTSFIQSVT